MIRPIRILYEDKRGPTKGFGPHELLVSCVADRVSTSRNDVADRLVAIPKNGDSKLYRTCRTEIARLARRGEPVVALFDDDKVRRLVKLPHETPKREVARAIVESSDAPSQLIVWILKRNIETVVDAACDILGEARGAKSHQDRDRLLQRIAWDCPERRVEVCTRADSFGCFVAGVARLWNCP